MRSPRLALDRLVDRREHLEQDEHDADEGERAGEAVAALHGADEHAHRDGEHRGQHAAQHEHDPPGDGEERSAFGRTPKNFHSLRSRRPPTPNSLLPHSLKPAERQAGRHAAANRGRAHSTQQA